MPKRAMIASLLTTAALILLISFFLNISVFVLQGKGQKERAQTLSKLCEKLVFIGVPVLYVALFLFVK